jgi:hypothetical protein
LKEALKSREKAHKSDFFFEGGVRVRNFLLFKVERGIVTGKLWSISKEPSDRPQRGFTRCGFV